MKVQNGCGWDTPKSWMNFDSSPTLRYERLPLTKRLYIKNAEPFPENVRYGDIVAGLPLPTSSCRLLYCSHVLEHLSFQDAITAIAHSYRLLQPGGTWRIVLPDLYHEVRTYLADEDAQAAERFMRSTGLGHDRRSRGLREMLVSRFGGSRHLWLWDYPSLQYRLSEAGFVNIRRATFNDSEHSEFSEVEREERWSDALGIQCQRPE